MNKDLLLLAAIAGVIAIAFALFVDRTALPLPRAFNPLADWSNGRVACAAADFAIIALIARIAGRT